tara:strand:+ start:170 stop:397 length:228 start_codon:yes stop_codon:yes gene_type:complete
VRIVALPERNKNKLKALEKQYANKLNMNRNLRIAQNNQLQFQAAKIMTFSDQWHINQILNLTIWLVTLHKTIFFR